MYRNACSGSTWTFSVPKVHVQETTNTMEALQLQLRAISNEIQRKHSDKEEFVTKIHELRTQLGECAKKMNALNPSFGAPMCARET